MLQLAGLSEAALAAEVAGSRQALAACGIPPAAIQGWRGPRLGAPPGARRAAAAAGLLYDSSLLELGGSGTYADSLSRGMAQRVWPFSLTWGVPINCAA